MDLKQLLETPVMEPPAMTPDAKTLVHGVYLNPDKDMVHQHIKRTRAPFEPATMDFWMDSLRSDAWAVDVGAYTGLYAIKAALWGAPTTAFEPSPRIYARMEENAARNCVDFEMHPCALFSQNGQSTFATGPESFLSSAGMLASKGTLTVRVRTLDAVLDGRKPSIIKIDVEGAESHVIKGAVKTIKQFRPRIIAEANTAKHADMIYTALNRFGYNFRYVDKRNILCTPT